MNTVAVSGRSGQACVARLLEPTADSPPLVRAVNGAMLALIAVNLLAMVLESVAEIHAMAPRGFYWFEHGSLAIFAVEYALRVWSCPALPRYRGRLRFVLSPMAIIDLLTILPLLIPTIGVDLRAARVLRLFRVVRVAKLARYSRTLRLFGHVFRERATELVVVLAVLATLLLLASSLMYYAENGAQPEVFSSIPATLWWSIATLTTVGYGDVYPVTGLGKLLAGVICVLGIGMFALPTSILGAAFTRQLEEAPRRCRHCGEIAGGASPIVSADAAPAPSAARDGSS